jgi:DeoR family fructose operon transcriptional repressor
LLMDITKIDKTMPYTFATLKDIDILICDADLPDDIKKAAQENGVLIY